MEFNSGMDTSESWLSAAALNQPCGLSFGSGVKAGQADTWVQERRCPTEFPSQGLSPDKRTGKTSCPCAPINAQQEHDAWEEDISRYRLLCHCHTGWKLQALVTATNSYEAEAVDGAGSSR